MGHVDEVRCIKYLESEDLLLSAGVDPNIKVWDLNRFMRRTDISTNSHGDMDGSIVYILENRLVGAGFKSGHIRLYHLFKKNLVFEIRTGFYEYYIYGLSYLPKRKLIIASVNNNTVKVWRWNSEDKRAEEDQIINTKSEHQSSIKYNEDETQLIFATEEPFLESYDLSDKERTLYYVDHIKMITSVLYVEGIKKVFVYDTGSGNITVLSASIDE